MPSEEPQSLAEAPKWRLTALPLMDEAAPAMREKPTTNGPEELYRKTDEYRKTPSDSEIALLALAIAIPRTERVLQTSTGQAVRRTTITATWLILEAAAGDDGIVGTSLAECRREVGVAEATLTAAVRVLEERQLVQVNRTKTRPIVRLAPWGIGWDRLRARVEASHENAGTDDARKATTSEEVTLPLERCRADERVRDHPYIGQRVELGQTAALTAVFAATFGTFCTDPGPAMHGVVYALVTALMGGQLVWAMARATQRPEDTKPSWRPSRRRGTPTMARETPERRPEPTAGTGLGAAVLMTARSRRSSERNS